MLCYPDLAVIFRPGLISHPNHELLPREHQLSQEVLEFLIEHQDWFMLDIPPPPTSSTSRHDSINASPLSSPLSPTEDEDLMVVPSSDDDQPKSEATWKLVERARKVDRRRTVSERHRTPMDHPAAPAARVAQQGVLSPVSESPTVSVHEPLNGGSVTVTRSRTMPSRRPAPKEGASSEERAPQGNVLKKQKRASAQTHQRQRTMEKNDISS